MSVYFKFLVKHIQVFVILVSVYTSLMILIQWIPNYMVRENISKSATILKSEGPRKVVIPGVFERYRILDGHSDCLMLDMAIRPHGLSSVDAAMLNECYCHLKGDGQPDGYKFADDLFKAAHDDVNGLDLYRYGRCWNGYLVYLKPLLTIMDLNYIRIMNFLVFTILFVICLVTIWKIVSPSFSIAFGCLMLYFNYYLAPLCIQYMQSAVIILFGSLFVLVNKWVYKNIYNTSIFFFTIGSIIAFIDVLTLPQLTLGMPLLFYCLKRRMDISQKELLLICFCWFAGFSMTWGSKFVIGSVLTGVNILTDAINAAQMRTSTTLGNESLSVIRVVSSLRILIPLMVVVIPFLLYYWRNMIKRGNYKKMLPVFWIFLIVPIWFVILSNHSFVHILFTYRAWILPSLCIYTIFFLTINKNYQC